MKCNAIKVLVAVVMAGLMIGTSRANIMAIDLSQNASGKYELRTPVILDARDHIKWMPNANVCFSPILTSAENNIQGLGFQMSRYDLTLGTSFILGRGIFSLDFGFGYRPPMNREGYLETLQTTLASRWYFVW